MRDKRKAKRTRARCAVQAVIAAIIAGFTSCFLGLPIHDRKLSCALAIVFVIALVWCAIALLLHARADDKARGW